GAHHIQAPPPDRAEGAGGAGVFGAGGDRRPTAATLSSEYGSLIALGPVLRRSGLGASAGATSTPAARGGSVGLRCSPSACASTAPGAAIGCTWTPESACAGAGVPASGWPGGGGFGGRRGRKVP